MVKMKLIHSDGESLAVGVFSSEIDADLEVCVAYEFAKETRERLSELKKKRVTKQKIIKENDHCQLYLTERNFGIPGLLPRDGRVMGMWKRDGNTCWIAYEDTMKLEKPFPKGNDVVQVKMRATWKFEVRTNEERSMYLLLGLGLPCTNNFSFIVAITSIGWRHTQNICNLCIASRHWWRDSS